MFDNVVGKIVSRALACIKRENKSRGGLGIMVGADVRYKEVVAVGAESRENF